MSDRICLINKGEIQQIGTPHDLYFRPENLFVADFLGESNLLDATVVRKRDNVVLLEGPGGAQIEAVAPREVVRGQRLKFMIRPENVRILAAGERADSELTAKLQDVILMGQVTKFYATLADGTDVSATQLTSPSIPKLSLGDEVRFGFDVESTVALPLSDGENHE